MERTHLSGKEYATLQSLFATVSTFTACLDHIQKRCEKAGCWEQMQEVARLSSDCLDIILSTVPEYKLLHIKKDLGNIRLHIKVEPPGLEHNETAFSYVPTTSLNDLLNYVCQHECYICDKTAVESRKCPYRKMIEDALPHDVDAKDREHCKYSDMSLGLD